jgi:hypothetical protein
MTTELCSAPSLSETYHSEGLKSPSFPGSPVDLYQIPGDTGGNWRLRKFVEYQHEVPSIHYRVLGEYIQKYVKDLDDAVMMCWYMSVTYNEVTCILLQELFEWKTLSPRTVREYCQRFWEEAKPVLDFGSSRKYAKNMDWFPVLMESFIRTTHCHPYRWLSSLDTGDPIQTYTAIYKAVLKLPYTGRFAADLFMESVTYLSGYFDIGLEEPSKLDWNKCSNLTSGLLNIFYFDAEANSYDKTGKLPVPEEFLTEKLEVVQKEIERVYPEQDNSINLFVGKICSFRNLFKSARYGGFHHDRELGVLIEYQRILPEYSRLWNRLFRLRRSMFDPRFLGELNDWNGIRPERKKLWLRKGLTGVEENAC